MYERICGKYFDNVPADQLHGTRGLAAMAQFDIHPRAEVLNLSKFEEKCIKSLSVKADRPPSWYFLDAAAAELVLLALWWKSGVDDAAGVAEYAALDVIKYFRDIQAEGLRPPPTLTDLESDLLKVLRNPLKLAGKDAENRLRAAVVDSEPVQVMLAKIEPLPTLSVHLQSVTFELSIGSNGTFNLSPNRPERR